MAHLVWVFSTKDSVCLFRCIQLTAHPGIVYHLIKSFPNTSLPELYITVFQHSEECYHSCLELWWLPAVTHYSNSAHRLQATQCSDVSHRQNTDPSSDFREHLFLIMLNKMHVGLLTLFHGTILIYGLCFFYSFFILMHFYYRLLIPNTSTVAFRAKPNGICVTVPH